METETRVLGEQAREEAERRRRGNVLVGLAVAVALIAGGLQLWSGARTSSALDHLQERLDTAYEGTDADTLDPIVAGSLGASWDAGRPDPLYDTFFIDQVGSSPHVFETYNDGRSFRAVWTDESLLVNGCVVTEWSSGYRSFQLRDACPR